MASRPNASPAGTRSDAWFLLASLGAVALGVLLIVGLLYRVGLDGEPAGAMRLIVSISDGVGFIAPFYACLLIVLWGGVAFVSGRLRGPLRRMVCTLVLGACLSLLTASLGGDGGRLGASASVRLIAVLGRWPTVFLFGAMTLVAGLLATDWLFFRSFVRLAAEGSPTSPAAVTDPGLVPAEEAVLAGEKAPLVEAMAEPLGEPTATPREPPPRPREQRRRRTPAAAEMPVDRALREQDLVDRAVAEARREVGSPIQPVAPPMAKAVPDLELDDSDLTQARQSSELDPFADLDDEDLLAKAGAEIEKLWSGGEAGGTRIGAAATPAATPESEMDPFVVPRDIGTREARAERRSAAEPAPAEPAPAERAHAERAHVEPANEDEETGAEPSGGEEEVDVASDEPEVVLEPVPPRRDPSAQPVTADEELAAIDDARDDDGAGDVADAGAGDVGAGDVDDAMVQEELFVDEPPDPALIDEAAQIVLTARRPMPSLLQRHLKLSFAQARQTMAYLEKLGVVGPPDGAGPWQPLIDLDEWRRRRA